MTCDNSSKKVSVPRIHLRFAHHSILKAISRPPEKRGELDKAGRAELQDLRDELARIKAAKEEYVTAHPEHRKYVYPYSEQSGSGSGSKNDGDAGANQGPLGKDGVPRNPERSVYYHPVFNPFGVPPPGMPYLEKREQVELCADMKRGKLSLISVTNIQNRARVFLSFFLPGILAPEQADAPDQEMAGEDEDEEDSDGESEKI